VRLAGLLVVVALEQVHAVFRLGLLEAAGLVGQHLGGRQGHRGADHGERQGRGKKYFLKHRVTPLGGYRGCTRE